MAVSEAAESLPREPWRISPSWFRFRLGGPSGSGWKTQNRFPSDAGFLGAAFPRPESPKGTCPPRIRASTL